MPHDARKCLEDIRISAALIQQFCDGRSLADFEADPLLRAGVERHFEIIGESIVRLRKIDLTIAESIPDQRKIVSFRNLLIHGYDVIKNAEVWEIIEKELPSLAATVANRLESEQSL